MSGTVAGGRKARETNLAKYGSDFFAKAGHLGGIARVPKGFSVMDKEKVRAAGRKGGLIGKRGPKVPVVNLNDNREDFWPEPDEVFDFHIEPKPLKHKFLWWRW